ncbi:hypothetical protein [Streptomyces sp. V4I8]
MQQPVQQQFVDQGLQQPQPQSQPVETPQYQSQGVSGGYDTGNYASGGSY